MADRESTSELDADDREWLAAVRETESLAALAELVDEETEHDAYLSAKGTWKRLRERELADPDDTEGPIPGRCIEVGNSIFTVHGITHADTDEERSFLRDGVRTYLDAGATVYCEQGIRPMYFSDMPGVCEMDDYRWAMYHCREQDIDSHIPGEIEREFSEDDSVGADITAVASQFREETFSLIDSMESVSGSRFASALGDVASDFLTAHEELGTGESFTSFRKSEQAARNPEHLDAIQRYYETAFLPQPLEREWLRRHDPELELFTHARNERLAAYALFHAPAETPVHIITGAAHQPGILYYLEAYRKGEWSYEPFEEVL
jgi:hypothetical protein